MRTLFAPVELDPALNCKVPPLDPPPLIINPEAEPVGPLITLFVAEVPLNCKVLEPVVPKNVMVLVEDVAPIDIAEGKVLEATTLLLAFVCKIADADNPESVIPAVPDKVVIPDTFNFAPINTSPLIPAPPVTTIVPVVVLVEAVPPVKLIVDPLNVSVPLKVGDPLKIGDPLKVGEPLKVPPSVPPCVALSVESNKRDPTISILSLK